MESTGRHEREHSGEYLVRHTETGDVIDINSPRYEEAEGVLRIGVYRHYKSTPEDLKYYAVEKVVIDCETDDRLVIYKPLYETTDNWATAKPLEMFKGNVAVGKGKIPRFRYIGQAF